MSNRPNSPDSKSRSRAAAARRRRARRLITPLDSDRQRQFYEEMAHRVSPSLVFFLLSLVSGLVLALALLSDQIVLLVLGLAAAPLMAPVIGVSLGTAMGSTRFFVRHLIAFGIGVLFVFIIGLLAGAAARFVAEPPITSYYLARFHGQLAWPSFAAVAIGAFFTALRMARGRARALSFSLLLTYGLYLPIISAGFGLATDMSSLWPAGLLVFLLHFTTAALVGVIVLALMGYRPPSLAGYTLGAALLLMGVLIAMTILGAGVAVGGQVGFPTTTPTVTLTPVPPTVTQVPTLTLAPPTTTSTATVTQTPTETLTPSPVPPTPTPTPVLAVVDVPGFDGARVRREPNGPTVAVLNNGTIVVLLGEEQEIDNRVWVRVQTIEEPIIEGWMVSTLLSLALPEE